MSGSTAGAWSSEDGAAAVWGGAPKRYILEGKKVNDGWREVLVHESMSMRTLFNQIKTVWIFALCAVVATLLTFQIVPAQAQSAGITVSKSTVTVEESGTTNSFTVVLDTQPETSVTLSATNSETTQFNISLSYLTFTNANWNAPQTITLTPTSDDVADGDTSATITFSVLDATSDDTYDNVADVTVAVTVSDNNTCDVTVVETNGTTMVTEAATTDTFTVKLAAQPFRPQKR